MADHVDLTIQQACEEVDRLAAEVAKKKAGVNAVCELFNRPPIYEDIEAPTRKSVTPAGRPDRFVGKPMAVVIRTILDARHAADVGPADVDTIHGEMIAGGYAFNSKNVDDQKLGLSVSLTKNSKVFRKVGKDLWGLNEWYGGKGSRPNGRKKDQVGEIDLDGIIPDAEQRAEEFGEPTEADGEAAEALKATKG